MLIDSSALLGMLPPPKRKLPASKSSVNKPIVPKVALPKPAANLPAPPGLVDSDSEDEGMVPASVRRKEKGKASVDLFGLGEYLLYRFPSGPVLQEWC
jgi:proline-rich protein PRCC